ncbi:hypothetical protein, partial [Vibrio thalassae]|uniref:hypothetical protein n=1 Tax=Vibrio thalassae TaxID=1243014 RepID=UPI003638E0A8
SKNSQQNTLQRALRDFLFQGNDGLFWVNTALCHHQPNRCVILVKTRISSSALSNKSSRTIHSKTRYNALWEIPFFKGMKDYYR